MRWFCADVSGRSAADTTAISEQLQSAQSTISSLFAEKSELTQLLSKTQEELAGARDANQNLRDLATSRIDEAKNSLA